MPGMNSGLNISDPTVVAAFKAALLHQGLLVLLIFAVLGLAWVSLRAWLPAASSDDASTVAAPAKDAEPAWRQLLRTGFGFLWILDGILQAQPGMAVGLPSQVIEPVAASSPRLVQHVVNLAGTAWSFHPMQAGASAVWIQIGIGIWLVVAARGGWSRAAGLVSAGWGLVVWVFGEAFGGIFAPGLTWLFGAPGAALLYSAAGLLIALPERAWRTRLLGRVTLGGMGVFLAGMAVLQAWPGRGFWQGTSHGQPGSLTAMVQAMAATPQPGVLSSWVSAFAGFDAGHGYAVNLLAVIGLALAGAAFLSGRLRLIRPALIGFGVLCVADWVLIEDFGFFGGLGTDPNSMLPMILLASGGYLALAKVPAPAAEPRPAAGPAAKWRDRVRLAAAPRSLAAASFSSVASAGAVAMIIIGAAPMAAAQANPVADTILAQAIDGSSTPLSYPAPGFSLTDQNGRTVTLPGLRGKVILLTFLDPVCTTDCPLIGAEFRQASQLLAADSQHVELVAINYNPLYTQVSYLRAYDHEVGLGGVPDWRYLTGSRAQLQQVWHSYGLPLQILPAGSMIGHGDYVFAIDQTGQVRRELGFDPGPGTASTQSSFAAELADTARQLLGQP
jgi:cytochrome oxidase Cu insertion factor (SCO1/SenC/PrrC family)